jgi:hypothetical protein
MPRGASSIVETLGFALPIVLVVTALIYSIHHLGPATSHFDTVSVIWMDQVSVGDPRVTILVDSHGNLTLNGIAIDNWGCVLNLELSGDHIVELVFRGNHIDSTSQVTVRIDDSEAPTCTRTYGDVDLRPGSTYHIILVIDEAPSHYLVFAQP